jgi:lipopolysaccharide/colanic/teichoic acid biosynthesis glycosyltransferase
LAATGQRPDVFQTPASHAQFVAVPSQDARIVPVATPVVRPSWPRTGFYQRRGKRIFDLAVGTALLLALSPLLLIVAASVLVRSGWPIFYGSERVGLDGRRFQMWKFRTMVRDADAVFERWKETHPERATHLLTHWRLEADPRVTALGRFLRKSSLDELPQFWNVLCGEMSIAGPRPYLSRESLDPDLARAIISVRPGLTGPFQVRGRKGLSPHARMQLEAGYAEDVGLIKDIAYMIRTLRPLMELDGH